MKNLKRFSIILVFTFLSVSLFAADKTVSLETSLPENGAVNVSVDVELVLTFTSNVINMKVSDNNKKCFSLTDEKGGVVDLQVSMGDDQIEPDVKRIITLIPDSPLKKGTGYKLVISSGLQAKNGSTLGSDLTLSFKTEK